MRDNDIFVYNLFKSNNSSWANCIKNLFKFQKYLYKIAFVGDKTFSLSVQKIILNSNFGRLLAIVRNVLISSFNGIMKK